MFKQCTRIFFVSLLISLTNLIIAQKTDLEENSLKGNAKYLKECGSFEVDIRFGEINKGERNFAIVGSDGHDLIAKEYFFNESGNIIKQNDFYTDGRLYSSTHKKYDKDNKLIESVVYSGTGSILNKRIIQRDKEGKAIEQTIINAKGEITMHLKHSFENGNLREIYSVDAHGNKVSTLYEMKYDSNGNLIDEIDDKGIYSRHTYKYNTSGDKLEEQEYNAFSDHPIKVTQYIYDSEGYESIEYSYVKDQSVNNKIVKRYNSNGNLIEEHAYNGDGEAWNDVTYEYDDNGGQILMQGILWEEEYVNTSEKDYDQHGNWIRSVWFSNTIPKRMTERIVEYYQ